MHKKQKLLIKSTSFLTNFQPLTKLYLHLFRSFINESDNKPEIVSFYHHRELFITSFISSTISFLSLQK
jgi:hypothetical protein